LQQNRAEGRLNIQQLWIQALKFLRLLKVRCGKKQAEVAKTIEDFTATNRESGLQSESKENVNSHRISEFNTHSPFCDEPSIQPNSQFYQVYQYIEGIQFFHKIPQLQSLNKISTSTESTRYFIVEMVCLSLQYVFQPMNVSYLSMIQNTPSTFINQEITYV